MSKRFACSWTGISLILVISGLAFNVLGKGWAAESDRSDDSGFVLGTVLVASVIGDVEYRNKNSEVWSSLEPGLQLVQGDEIRTGGFSQAILRPNQGATITVTPNTSFIIGDETPSMSRFTLGIGRISADIETRIERTYEFESAIGSAVADTTGGEFHVIADSEGMFGVLTESGEIGLTSQGRRVVVSSGMQSLALPGKAPDAPFEIPTEVFLQVEWPSERTDKPTIVVEGKTHVGNRLRFAEQVVALQDNGRFQIEIPLEQGENQVSIIAEDGVGNIRKLQSPVMIRQLPREPRLRLEVERSVWE